MKKKLLIVLILLLSGSASVYADCSVHKSAQAITDCIVNEAAEADYSDDDSDGFVEKNSRESNKQADAAKRKAKKEVKGS